MAGTTGTSSAYRARPGDDSGVLEADLVRLILDSAPSWSLVYTVVQSNSRWAEFGRLQEDDTFPEIDMRAAMAPYDDLSVFTYVVDLEARRIGYLQRIVRPRSEEAIRLMGETGLEVIDDRLRATDPAERASLEEIRAHHGIDDLSRCWNVVSSINTGRAVNTSRRPYTLLGYKGLFLFGRSAGLEHYLAYVNSKALKSFGRIGLPFELLMDGEYHLHTDEGPLQEYVAIDIAVTAASVKVFIEPRPGLRLAQVLAATDLQVALIDDDHVEPVVSGQDDGVVIDLVDDADVVIDLTDGAAPRVSAPLGHDSRPPHGGGAPS